MAVQGLFCPRVQPLFLRRLNCNGYSLLINVDAVAGHLSIVTLSLLLETRDVLLLLLQLPLLGSYQLLVPHVFQI